MADVEQTGLQRTGLARADWDEIGAVGPGRRGKDCRGTLRGGSAWKGPADEDGFVTRRLGMGSSGWDGLTWAGSFGFDVLGRAEDGTGTLQLTW